MITSLLVMLVSHVGVLQATPPQTTPPQTTPPQTTPPGTTPPGSTPPATTPPGTPGPGTPGPVPTAQGAGAAVAPKPTSLYDFTVNDATATPFSFSAFQGKPMIIVNTAGYSVLSSQLRDLDNFYRQQNGHILVVAFPSNSFGHEGIPGISSIGNRYASVFGVTFPVMSGVDVTGPSIAPIFRYLIANSPQPGMGISGDFTKFFVDANGKVVGRLGPNDTPLSTSFIRLAQSIN
jgi:glutathione peroxidase